MSGSPLLAEMAAHKSAVIQCHDDPDADAIASGHALGKALARRGVQTRLVYGGPRTVTKPSLVWMLRLLGIKLERAAAGER